METLGALTRGDRRAAHAGSDALSKYNYETELGLLVANETIRSIVIACLCDYSKGVKRQLDRLAGPAHFNDDTQGPGGVALDSIELTVREFKAAGTAGANGQKTANSQLDSVKNATREHMERAFVNKALKNFHELRLISGALQGAAPDLRWCQVAKVLCANVAAYKSIIPSTNDTAYPWTTEAWAPTKHRHALSPKPFRSAVWMLLLVRRSRRLEHRLSFGSLPDVLFHQLLYMASDRIPPPERTLTMLTTVGLCKELAPANDPRAGKKEKKTPLLPVKTFLNRSRNLYSLFETSNDSVNIQRVYKKQSEVP
jgi:hypothetical protein